VANSLTSVLSPASRFGDAEPRRSAPPKLLGEILIQQSLITPAQLNKALERHKRSRQPLGQVLVDMGFVTADVILETLSGQVGIPSTRVNVYTVDAAAVSVLPEKIARQHFVFPLIKVGNTLMIAVAGPTDIEALDDLRFAAGCRIQPVLALEEEIAAALDRYYGGAVWQAQDTTLLADPIVLEASTVQVDVNDEEGEGSAIQVVEHLIARAVGDRASDIHIEPMPDGTRVRFRVDGMISEVAGFPSDAAPAVRSRIKVLAGIDIAEHRLPQDGRFSATIGSRHLDLRTSTYPGMYGEKVVLRLLDQSVLRLQLDNLGMDLGTQAQFRELIQRNEGIVLITGPTGSGKTSTLYAALSEIVDTGKNIMTVEDPVEYAISGITQGQTNVKAGFTFAKGLRAILRQDPDVIMVGEIRDSETLETAIEASLTGHLVLSTAHTNNGIATITRLQEMGAEAYVLASSVIGILAQRLVRRICVTCKKDIPVTPAARALFAEAPTMLYRGVGCKDCRGTGFRGRVGIYEIVTMNDELRRLIIERGSESQLLDAARRQGMRSLREECLAKVAAGETTIEEAVRITYQRN
jgi:type IV pilus assembly protein PilB